MALLTSSLDSLSHGPATLADAVFTRDLCHCGSLVLRVSALLRPIVSSC